MVKEEGGRAEARGGRESGGDGFDGREIDRGVRRRVGKDEVSDLEAAVHHRFLKEDVFDYSLIDDRTCVLEKGCRSPVVEMAIPPEIDGSSVAVIADKLAVDDRNRGKVEVVGA